MTCIVSDRHIQVDNCDYLPIQISPRVCQIHTFRKYNWDCFYILLLGMSYLFLMTLMTSGVLFYGILIECLDTFIPLKAIMSKNQNDVHLSSKTAKRTFEKTNLDEDLTTHRKHKNEPACLVYLVFSISIPISSPRITAQMYSHKKAGVTPLASLDSINELFRTVAISNNHEAANQDTW